MKLLSHDNRPDLVELLLLLEEEAAEVIQASSKIIRFGLAGQSHASPHSNIRHLAIELNDLLTVIGLIVHESDLPISYEEITNSEAMEKKLEKIRLHTNYQNKEQ
jgi:NTP pyrophosphatase (non-canonical NTP hydrolase)